MPQIGHWCSNLYCHIRCIIYLFLIVSELSSCHTHTLETLHDIVCFMKSAALLKAVQHLFNIRVYYFIVAFQTTIHLICLTMKSKMANASRSKIKPTFVSRVRLYQLLTITKSTSITRTVISLSPQPALFKIIDSIIVLHIGII